MHHAETAITTEFGANLRHMSMENIFDSPIFRSCELDDVVAVVAIAVIISLWFKNALLSKPQDGYELYFISPQREDGLDGHSNVPMNTPLKNINDRIDGLKKDIVVFWGSQSGTSERLAKEFGRECSRRFGLAAMVSDADTFDFRQIEHLAKGRIIGFVVATYGEGDPTDNALGLYDYLQELRLRKTKELSQVKYFCFGLGSSQYQSYNRFVDFVDAALSSAGAKRIVSVGKLDENNRSNDSWTSWKESAIQEIALEFGKHEQEPSMHSLVPTLSLFESSAKAKHNNVESHAAEETIIRRNANEQNHIAQLEKICRISDSNVNTDSLTPIREYLHVEVSTHMKCGTLKYRTGDHLAIWPVNPDLEVHLFATMFQWEKHTLDNVVDLRANSSIGPDSIIPVRTPTTRLAILRYQVDICSRMTPEVMRLLIMYCPTEEGKAFLEKKLASEKHWDAIIEQHLTCAKIMHLASPRQRWPEEAFCALIQILPKLRPRYFSIASSPIVNPESIALTVGVVKEQLSQGDAFFGLNTGYLLALADESEVHNVACVKTSVDTVAHPQYNLTGPRSILAGRKMFVHVRPSPFKPPQSIELPIVMFAAGSGIAPFRAFVQERMSLKKKGEEVGQMTLFFGCRSRNDLLYADLWEEAAALGILQTNFAFSTHLSHGKKVYIQDLLRQPVGKGVVEAILNQQAVTYICGSSEMARGVKKVLDDLVTSKNSISRLKQERRLYEDVWVS